MHFLSLLSRTKDHAARKVGVSSSFQSQFLELDACTTCGISADTLVLLILFGAKSNRCQARLSLFLLLFKKRQREKTKQAKAQSPRPCCAVGGLRELPLSNHKKASVEPARGPGTAFPSPAAPGLRLAVTQGPVPTGQTAHSPCYTTMEPLSLCATVGCSHCVELQPQAHWPARDSCLGPYRKAGGAQTVSRRQTLHFY